MDLMQTVISSVATGVIVLCIGAGKALVTAVFEQRALKLMELPKPPRITALKRAYPVQFFFGELSRLLLKTLIVLCVVFPFWDTGNSSVNLSLIILAVTAVVLRIVVTSQRLAEGKNGKNSEYVPPLSRSLQLLILYVRPNHPKMFTYLYGLNADSDCYRAGMRYYKKSKSRWVALEFCSILLALFLLFAGLSYYYPVDTMSTKGLVVLISIMVFYEQIRLLTRWFFVLLGILVGSLGLLGS